MFMYKPIPPTNMPVPANVGKNGALIFYSQAAIPAEAPIDMKFCFPIKISIGISNKPI